MKPFGDQGTLKLELHHVQYVLWLWYAFRKGAQPRGFQLRGAFKDRGKPTKPEPALSVPLGTTSGLSLIQFS